MPGPTIFAGGPAFTRLPPEIARRALRPTVELDVAALTPADDTADLQLALGHLGARIQLSGTLDDDTIGAIRAFQVQHQLPITGEFDPVTVEQMFRSLPSDPAPPPPQDEDGPPESALSLPPTCLVIDAQALIRTGPPAFASTGATLAKGAVVELLEQLVSGSNVNARVREVGAASDGVWTRASNLASSKDHDPSLRPGALASRSAPTPLRTKMADIHDRLGGYLQQKANELGVDVAGLAAIVAAESNGSGFNLDGSPVVRFENHQFYQHWGIGHTSTFDSHFRFSSTRRWEGHRVRFDLQGEWLNVHITGSTSQIREHQTLAFARTFDNRAALRSQSAGLAQVMGFHDALLGFASPEALYAAMSASLKQQLDAMFGFIRATPNAWEGLRTRDWEQFAGAYNGAGKAAEYGAIIAAAVAAWRDVAPADSGVPTLLAATHFLPTGADDGDFGSFTDRATRAFQARAGLGIDGLVGTNTRKAAGLASAGQPLIRSGSKGEAVKTWQRFLIGATLLEDAHPTPDALARAVRAWQILHQQPVTGNAADVVA